MLGCLVGEIGDRRRIRSSDLIVLGEQAGRCIENCRMGVEDRVVLGDAFVQYLDDLGDGLEDLTLVLGMVIELALKERQVFWCRHFGGLNRRAQLRQFAESLVEATMCIVDMLDNFRCVGVMGGLDCLGATLQELDRRSDLVLGCCLLFQTFVDLVESIL